MFALATGSGLISSLSARWWLAKYSLIQASSFSLLFLCFGSFCFGLSAYLGIIFLDFASILIGIGMGSSNICMNLLVSKGTGDKHRRQFFSGLHSIYGIGSFCAPILLGFWSAYQRPWYEFFMFISLIPLVTFFWSLSLKPQDESSQVQIENNQKAHPIQFSERMMLGCLFGCYVSSEVLISSRLVYYLELGHNFPIDTARWALSCFFAMLLLGRLLFTIIPFKGQSLSWLMVSCISSLFIFSLSLFHHPLWLMMMGLSMSFFYPVGMDWLSKLYTSQLEQLMPSILTFVSLFLISMHLLFGLMTDYLGIKNAILITYVLQGGVLVLILSFRQLCSTRN